MPLIVPRKNAISVSNQVDVFDAINVQFKDCFCINKRVGKLAVPVRSRVQENVGVFGELLDQIPPASEIREAVKRLNSSPFLIDILINSACYSTALFDSGCLPYAVFDHSFADQAHLPRLPVTHRFLKLAKDGPQIPITEMTWATLEIDGRAERVFGYIVPNLQYNIILGKGWAERNNVTYEAVKESGWMERDELSGSMHQLRQAKNVTASIFAAEIRRGRKANKHLHLFSITVADINKALKKIDNSAVKQTVEEISNQLPQQLRHLAKSFLADEDGVLPESKPGWDRSINLELDDEGKPKEPPSGPFYGMSRDELLVLRKTLTGYLRKGWIRASNFPANAPVEEVIRRLEESGLRLDINKCTFATSEVKYLGFVIKAGEGVTADPAKIEANKNWEEPTTVSETRSFLGFANFYQEFILKFSAIAQPLISLTSKQTRWSWNTKEKDAFEKLKSMLSSAPLLALFPAEKETYLEADASGYAIGGILSQIDEKNRLRPVGYFSRKLTPAESNYNIHDKELLAIITTMRHFDAPRDTSDERLQGRNIQLFKNNLSTSSPEEFILNTINIVDFPDMTLKHIETDQNIMPSGQKLFEDKEIASLWDEALEKDQAFHSIHASVAVGQSALAIDLKLGVQMTDCSLDDRGALTRRGALWVPNWEPLRTTIIQRSHDSSITGHPGRDGTLHIASRAFFWPQQYLDIRRFTRNCSICSRSKAWRQCPQGLLRPLPVPERFHSELSVDFMTDLPAQTEDDPKYLMVITDRLLKSCALEAMNSMEAEACVERFLTCHYRFHGFP
ncbi:hypothetical protein K3495_g7177 [Podosphaera aphanis]|nr:hypothetical protein K3495_g7177 [Podosphaera aphanis]